MNRYAKSTTKTAATPPSKPSLSFPLFAHRNGQWAKKIRGKLYYFGPWSDPVGALNVYLEQQDDLLAGREPATETDGLTLREMANHFLTAKKRALEAGAIGQRTFDEYKKTCELVLDRFGKQRAASDVRSDDFGKLRQHLAKTNGPTALGNRIQRVRTIFKFAYEMELIERPARFGPDFKKPSRRVMRIDREKRGAKLFSAEEIRSLLIEAGQPMETMILLGINCGFGNHDCATLPRSALDLKRGWVDYTRPRTGIRRRCKLWPETVASLKDALKHRYKPRAEDDEALVFITKYKSSWVGATSANPISQEMRKLLDEIGVSRKGVGFYALRHTFATIAGETADQVAVDFVMGHAPDTNDMAARYRETISDQRLERVAEIVRKWLYAEKPKRSKR